MIRLFISEWDGRCDRLQISAEHNVILKHLSWRSRWIILCTLERKMAASHEISRADRCLLACSSDWARAPSLLCDKCAVYRCLVAGQLYPSCGFSSGDCRCFQLSNRCHEFHAVSFVHQTVLTDRDFKPKLHLSMEFSWFCLSFFADFRSRQFPKVK